MQWLAGGWTMPAPSAPLTKTEAGTELTGGTDGVLPNQVDRLADGDVGFAGNH